ncbi:MAG: Fic family protein, partial [Candidatus Aenigmarchaeota archaeon]|nr:Fic family protein [Candidatus Aenigmarchaeota archaeon]
RIIKRKKGSNRYYYLQHSFRRTGKVITREVYLGKEIPKNIEEIKQKLKNQSKADVYKKLAKIKKNFRSEWKNLPKSAIERELKEIAIAFTYNTNAIEGSAITLEEVREIIEDKIAPHKPISDIKETESHAAVFLEMLDKKVPISIPMLLRWHQEIFGETKPDISGRFRRYLVRVGDYIAPDWQEAEKLMSQLIVFIRRQHTMNPVELAGMAHYKFEKIHPFGDGNGRIGRLIMNYILWHSGYPMIIVEYKNRRSYYKALRKSEEQFLDYFLKRYLSVHKKRCA